MKRKYKFFIPAIFSMVLPIAQTSFAQFSLSPPNINATPLPLGSGARAIGQGGAFIAVADDATAASWNPGALIQLEKPELSVVGSFLSTQQDFDPGNTGWSLGDEAVSRGDLNYASVAYPFRVFRKNMVAALNYQQKYDFHMDLDFDQIIEDKTSPSVNVKQKIDFESTGGVGALTPAISLLVVPKLSVGVAVNFYTDEFFGDYAWKQTTKATGSGNLEGANITTKFDEDKTFRNFQAVNVTIGLLWDVWEKEDKLLTFGARYDTPYTADVDRITDVTSIVSPLGQSTFHDREHFEIDYPMAFGAGLGFRYSDALSFSMDITWTDWSVFKQKDEDGNKTRPLGGVSTGRKIDDTYAVKCGTEYLIFRQKAIIPVRGGLFYDPRPSLDNPTDVYGFSVGSGITFKRFSLDGAYQFRWADDVNGEDFGLSGTEFDLNDHMFLTSITVYF
ncbi:MAG: outer membrane protein transport protein [Candidatus Brocadia sp.]|nr:outer membrane protein transport protein [Candidatus Brocadia sp.]